LGGGRGVGVAIRKAFLPEEKAAPAQREAKNCHIAIAVLACSVLQGRKSFLVLFFKKELLSSLKTSNHHSATPREKVMGHAWLIHLTASLICLLQCTIV
jgi:hypothetical protein